MTLDEKIAEVHGVGYPLIADPTAGYAGKIPGNPRLGIPAVYLADSPVGVGNGSTGVTQWADTAALAATWDTDVAGQYGRAYGAEQAGKGHNVALGPTINILRLPNWGRAPETFSEDPYLTAQQAAAEIKGIQSQHVIATAKHFVANNQEVQRSSINVVASEKARKEIYQPAFKAAVQAGVGAIMCSYNRVGGTYACANADDLIGTLRDAWNFDGMVMSDWGAVHSTVKSAKSGLDLEMPGVADEANPAPLDDLWGSYFNSRLKAAVQSGAVTTAELDGMVTHILTAMFRIGLFDHPTPDPVTVKDTNVSTPEHQALSERIAEQGTVLLKNAERCAAAEHRQRAVDRGHRRRREEPAHRRRRIRRGDPLGSGGHPAGRDHRARRLGHHDQLRAGHAGHQPAARGPGRRLRAASPRPTTAAPTSPARRSPRSRCRTWTSPATPPRSDRRRPGPPGTPARSPRRPMGRTGSRCRPAGTSRCSSTTSRSCPSPRCSSPPRTVWST